ncbi:enoyl-CoA hydratase/isomerase family protein, partial [Mycolicibacterium poriferae]|uniref:enoyl-CoA hydratase/isomerase family protein n=1 Tax=Mycolicibacterium poriferae TaxID=39694 RepID=UPI0024BAA5D3
ESDVVIASQDARICDPHVSVGLTSAIETIVLARRMPIGAVLRLALGGRSVGLDARRAYDLGMFDEICPAGEVLDRALALARAMDVAGIERVAVSDHVVFGENADAYGDPRVGGIQPTGPTAHGSNRSPCSRRSPHRRPGFDSTRHRQHGRHTQARTIRHRLDPLGIGVG